MQREYQVTTRWMPYLLDPTIPPEGKPRSRRTAPDDPLTPMEQRGQAGGLTFTRGGVLTPSSHLALQTAEFANDHDLHSDGLHRALFKAHFEDLENIGEPDVVVRIASEHGIDGEALREALDSGTYRERVDEQIEWARSLGVTGVPTFIFNDKYAIVGAQEYPVFQRVMAELGYSPRGEDAMPSDPPPSS